MSNAANPAIIYPTAEDLDGSDVAESSGWQLRVYLIPAEENDRDVPEVIAEPVIGAGCPAPAWHSRWLHLADLHPGVIGTSALAALQAREGELLSLAAGYEGSEWDGSNHRGSWDVEYHFELGEVEYVWDACDYLQEEDWESLCKDAEIDPTRARTEDLETLAKEVAAAVEPHLEAQVVRGLADHLEVMAEDWRDEDAEEVA